KIRFVHSVIDSNGDKITSGMVSYYIDGEFRINVSANQALQLKMNIPGKHNISVKYCGNNKYAFSNFAYVIITVGQIDPELNVTINDVNYPNKPVVNIKTNAKGNYTVKVANYVNEIVEVTGDEVNLTLNNLGVGDYVAEINFNGSEKFNPISMNVSFSILRKDAGFRLNSSIKNNDEIAYGSTITFIAFINDTQAEGSVDFYLDGVYNVTSNLLENVSFSSLDYGQHIITANYSGGDEFMDDSKSISFVVIDGRQDIDFVVYADPENAEIIYGDDLTLTPFALVFTSIEGNVDFYVDGVYNVTSNLMEDVILSNLAVGSHTIVAKYSGDSNYKNASYTLECNVLDSKADPEFDFITNIDNNSIEYGTILEINATAGFDVTGSIDYYVDDVYTATSNALSQSTFESVSFSNLDYGEHTIVACYSGDDNYLNKNYTFTFTVTGNLTDVKIELLIDGSKKTVVRINKTEFLNFSNIVTPYPGNVKIRLYNNGSDSGINGWYANSWLSKPFYDEGIYYYTAVFEGNDDYARAVSNQVTIIVGNPKIINTTSMALKCSPALNPQSVTYHVGEELGITSTILKGDGTGVLGIGNITFYDNGEFLQFIDLETSGSIIPIIYVTYDKAGMHNVSAYFSGNENYTSCNSWIQFEVERNDIDISINVNNVTYPSKVLANVTVTAPGNYSVIIHNKTYSIEFFDGETSKLVECDQILDAKTDYVVKVLFNQTDYYNSVNVSTIFEVLKNDSAEFNIFAESVSIQQGDSIKITSNLDNAYGDVIYSEGDKQLGNAPINNVFTYDKLTPGYHKIIANYTGDKNHMSVLRDITIFVNESHIMLNTTLNLKADKNDVVIGNAVIITSQVVDSNNDIVNEGNVTFYDENGEILGVNTLELNPTKNMTVIARYDGTNKYNPSESSISINVILNNASFKIVVSDVTLPDSPVAVVTTNAYGNYIIIVGNKSYDVEFKHGESLKEIALDNLVEGNYSAKLIYLGNDV
ncbi:MAG: Ig-like domain repeat protein, partial [Methanobrevibacter sp.]|nr:Ig-like domain repeat protein [Methanobrevibacter sp.]